MFLEPNNRAPGLELFDSLSGYATGLEKHIGRKHELKARPLADIEADVEHAVFIANVRNAPDEKHSIEIVGSHNAPSPTGGTERSGFGLSTLADSLTQISLRSSNSNPQTYRGSPIPLVRAAVRTTVATLLVAASHTLPRLATTSPELT